VRAATLALTSAGLLVLLAPAGAREPGRSASHRQDENPCLTSVRKRLLCPDLRMSPPSDLKLVRAGNGARLLRARNSLNSRGRGPAELRGIRTGRLTMRASQRIYRANGHGSIVVRTGAHLGFKFVPEQGRFWKFRHAARFLLWRLDGDGYRGRLVQRGPKVYYCLRDLTRTRAMPRSPRSRVYPSCSKSSKRRRVTLGTSVGWSDIYPSKYPEQYIDVTGLRGCYAYVHEADPKNGIYESNERNNQGSTVVRLPFRRAGRRGCPRDRGEEAPEETGSGGAEPDEGY
jgi:hypothetical protein